MIPDGTNLAASYDQHHRTVWILTTGLGGIGKVDRGRNLHGWEKYRALFRWDREYSY